MAELFPGEAQFAENAAKTFAGLDFIDELGSLPPTLAFAGIRRMARNVPAASKYLRGLADAPDPAAALMRMYTDAFDRRALAEADAAGDTAARDRRDRLLSYYAGRTGRAPEDVARVLDDPGDSREAVEARDRLYRL